MVPFGTLLCHFGTNFGIVAPQKLKAGPAKGIFIDFGTPLGEEGARFD